MKVITESITNFLDVKLSNIEGFETEDGEIYLVSLEGIICFSYDGIVLSIENTMSEECDIRGMLAEIWGMTKEVVNANYSIAKIFKSVKITIEGV